MIKFFAIILAFFIGLFHPVKPPIPQNNVPAVSIQATSTPTVNFPHSVAATPSLTAKKDNLSVKSTKALTKPVKQEIQHIQTQETTTQVTVVPAVAPSPITGPTSVPSAVNVGNVPSQQSEYAKNLSSVAPAGAIGQNSMGQWIGSNGLPITASSISTTTSTAAPTSTGCISDPSELSSSQLAAVGGAIITEIDDNMGHKNNKMFLTEMAKIQGKTVQECGWSSKMIDTIDPAPGKYNYNVVHPGDFIGVIVKTYPTNSSMRFAFEGGATNYAGEILKSINIPMGTGSGASIQIPQNAVSAGFSITTWIPGEVSQDYSVGFTVE